MVWIKRNLFFVIGSVVALGFMGVGVFYLFTQMSLENKNADQIAAGYAELTRLNQLNPSPGDGVIDNIKAAKEQETAIRAYVAKVRPYFQPIPAIPEISGTNRVSNSDFAAELRNTISSLHHTAEQQSVLLPPDYYFTFESQRKLMLFEPSSLDKLAVQLGEIKALSEILFDAKINSLDNIRRELVSSNDVNPSDFLEEKTISTPQADIVPYEVTFRCFSTELAYVLSHLAGSSNGFIVMTINVEPTSSGGDETAGGENGTPGGQPQPYRQPGYMAPGYPSRLRGYQPNPAVAPAPAAPARNSQVFLNEKPFRVTLGIRLVKIKSVAK